MSVYQVIETAMQDPEKYISLFDGCPFSADPEDKNRAGEVYIVFGSTGPFGPSLDLSALDGTDGFRLDGISEGDYSGFGRGRGRLQRGRH